MVLTVTGKASTIINGIDCHQERQRRLKMASLVYERENCPGDPTADQPLTDREAGGHSGLEIVKMAGLVVRIFSAPSHHFESGVDSGNEVGRIAASGDENDVPRGER